jgi:hypothetical protein
MINPFLITSMLLWLAEVNDQGDPIKVGWQGIEEGGVTILSAHML